MILDKEVKNMAEKVKAELKIPIPESFNDDLREFLRSAAREVIQEVVTQETRAKDYMSAKEVQTYMGISPNTLAEWIRLGLPVSVVGSKRYISKRHLDEFLEKHIKQ